MELEHQHDKETKSSQVKYLAMTQEQALIFFDSKYVSQLKKLSANTVEVAYFGPTDPNIVMLNLWNILAKIRQLRNSPLSEPRKIEDRADSVEMACLPKSVPSNAEYILCLVLNKQQREDVTENLFEEYIEISDKFGKRRADIWYWKQVVTSIYPFMNRSVMAFGLALLKRFLPFLSDYIETHWHYLIK